MVAVRIGRREALVAVRHWSPCALLAVCIGRRARVPRGGHHAGAMRPVLWCYADAMQWVLCGRYATGAMRMLCGRYATGAMRMLCDGC